MGYMRSFYEDNHFWELAPYETTDAGNLFANKAPLATANQDLSRIVAYFGDTVRQKLAIEVCRRALPMQADGLTSHGRIP